MSKKTDNERYKFLSEGGYLDTPERRKLGGKLWRKFYLLSKKREYRATATEHTIILKPEEELMLRKQANNHNLRTATYIKRAALAYVNKVYLTPKLSSQKELLEILVVVRSQAARILSQKQGLFSADKHTKVEQLIIDLQEHVKRIFEQPKDLEIEIRNALIQTPEFEKTLQKILIDHDSKVNGK